jgi:hypothetical protein
MSELRKDWSINSPEWAYNTPGWKPRCVRCNVRKECKKYNSDEPGMFAGEWICDSCLQDADYLTPAEQVFNYARNN